MRTTVAAAGLTLLVALALPGCGAEKPSSSAPSPKATSAAPSASASAAARLPPGVTATPPEPPAAAADTDASAEEFARYFAHTVHHVTRIRDTGPMDALALPRQTCTSCAAIADYIAGLKKDKLWETGRDLRIGELTVRSSEALRTVYGPMVYPRIGFVDVRGKEKAKQKTLDYVLSVDLVWDSKGKRWQVRDFTYAKAKKR